MDAIALDRSEQALNLLAERLPGWTLAWNTDLGVWVVRCPQGKERGFDRSPLDAVLNVWTRMCQIIPTTLVA